MGLLPRLLPCDKPCETPSLWCHYLARLSVALLSLLEGHFPSALTSRHLVDKGTNTVSLVAFLAPRSRQEEGLTENFHSPREKPGIERFRTMKGAAWSR